MKKLVLFLLASTCLFSCTQSQETTTQYQSEETAISESKSTTYKVIDVVDSIIAIYPNLYVNDVQKERFCACLRAELDQKLTEDNAFLQEIPMKFSQMLKKNNGKYLLKFECGKYTTNDKKLISVETNTEINFAIFAEVNEDFASTLEDNAIYIISGKYKGYVDKKMTLPSGEMFTFPTECYKFSTDENGTICLGGFLFIDLQLNKNN